MRTALIFGAALLVAASADAKTEKQKPKSLEPGAPSSSKPVKDKLCRDEDAVRFVGDWPSTPLAIVKKGISTPGQHCCAPWARRGSRWKTLDAYGQIVGEAELTGGEVYDVTQCYELGFALKKGKAGAGLFVDTSAHAWASPKSAAWAPTDAQKASLWRVVGDIEHAMVPTEPQPCGSKPTALPHGERALFFTRSVDDGQGKVARWAVIGGPLLIVARLQTNGRWVVRYTDALASSNCNLRAYTPRAVFDMNHDSAPEIVVHSDFGDSFGDFVLGVDGLGGEGEWKVVAQAVHSSTA